MTYEGELPYSFELTALIAVGIIELTMPTAIPRSGLEESQELLSKDSLGLTWEEIIKFHDDTLPPGRLG